ncbi:MAG: hypothetical protein ACYCZR_01735 [Burkholderiales bacterium]
MFRIALEPTYTIPVEIDIPGKSPKPSFDATFRRLSKSEYQGLMESNPNPSELAREVLVGWRGVVDGEGREIPFSAEALDALLDILPVADSIFLAYIASVNLALKKT